MRSTATFALTAILALISPAIFAQEITPVLNINGEVKVLVATKTVFTATLAVITEGPSFKGIVLTTVDKDGEVKKSNYSITQLQAGIALANPSLKDKNYLVTYAYAPDMTESGGEVHLGFPEKVSSTQYRALTLRLSPQANGQFAIQVDQQGLRSVENLIIRISADIFSLQDSSLEWVRMNLTQSRDRVQFRISELPLAGGSGSNATYSELRRRIGLFIQSAPRQHH